LYHTLNIASTETHIPGNKISMNWQYAAPKQRETTTFKHKYHTDRLLVMQQAGLTESNQTDINFFFMNERN